MVQILGIGAAQAPNEITPKEYGQISGAQGVLPGGRAFRSVLPIDHIIKTANSGLLANRTIATHTPAELGNEAARSALAHAGIEMGDVKMIIGDSCSPVETTPSEGQRVGRLLEHKVAAFDIVSPACALVQMIDVVRRWKNVPRIVLGVSTNTPTLHTDYSSISEGWQFGDGAAAFVLSNKLPGKIEVEESEVHVQPEGQMSLTVDSLGALKYDPRVEEKYFLPFVTKFLSDFEGKLTDSTRFVSPPFESVYQVISDYCEKHGLPPALETFRSEGNMFGNSNLSALCVGFESLTAGDRCVVLALGAGLTFGHAVLTVKG